ncbi:hypothetical protein AVEN_250164-1 [Araneus ventricosus]|uniref:Uncharacterized protein n=1 Tax=Araneus ventricosus TaxID=182803 RepID=A0A4Y2ML13_ARAVE|nr:hypothetical protein AVEN_250164-1 [Araneus ventricosus]
MTRRSATWCRPQESIDLQNEKQRWSNLNKHGGIQPLSGFGWTPAFLSLALIKGYPSLLCVENSSLNRVLGSEYPLTYSPATHPCTRGAPVGEDMRVRPKEHHPALPKHPGKQLKELPPQQIVRHCDSCMLGTGSEFANITC